MNERPEEQRAASPAVDDDGNSLSPLPGEPGIPNVTDKPRAAIEKKGLLAVAIATVSLIAISAISFQRWVGSGTKPEDADSKRASNRPAAATTEPRRLDLTPPAITASAPQPRIPAIVPMAEDKVEPIGVRRTGQGSGAPKPVLPEDAPVLLVSARPGLPAPAGGGQAVESTGGVSSGENGTDPMAQTRRNLDQYQRQLQGLLDNLKKTAAAATGGQASTPMASSFGTLLQPPTTPSTAAAGPLFGGQLQGSATPRVAASMLGNRSLILPKGTAFTCALKTRVVTAASGLVGCQVQRNVYSDDGRVLLIERGSHLDGEYRATSIKPGTVRIPVLWVRIRTPNGVTVNLDSPGTGPLGESGIDGYVDNRWPERIGAALLLSVIDDAVKLVIQSETSNDNNGTVVLQSTTSNTGKLAEKVLDSTINIPPLIYQNQGGIAGVFVARDVDFSSVYELRAVPR